MPNVSTTELQNTLDHIRQRKVARRLLTGPQNKAPDPSTAPDIEARIAKLQAVTTAAKTAAAIQPAVQPGLTTAKEFAGEPKRMTREEFRKLSAPDRARFVRVGGKLI